jgi:hypothetical protein
LKKARKGACKALASAEIQQVTNDRLLVVAKTEKKKGARTKGKDCGYGRVMGIEVIEQMEQEARDKAFLKAWNEGFNISPDIFTLTTSTESKAKLAKPRYRKPAKGKGKALDKEKEASNKGKERIEAVEAVEAEPEMRSRAGRAIKRTAKVQEQM